VKSRYRGHIKLSTRGTL